jgi:AmiR/NasT family two-component response regulator
VIGRLNDLLELSRVHVVEAPPATDVEPDAEDQLRARLAHRDRQLASLPDIEQAKGMLVHALGVTEGQAFDTLVRLSQHTNTKLRDVAVLLRDELAGTASDQSRRAAEEQIVHLRDRLRSGRVTG